MHDLSADKREFSWSDRLPPPHGNSADEWLQIRHWQPPTVGAVLFQPVGLTAALQEPYGGCLALLSERSFSTFDPQLAGQAR